MSSNMNKINELYIFFNTIATDWLIFIEKINIARWSLSKKKMSNK